MKTSVRNLFCAGIVFAAATGIACADTVFTDYASFAASAPGLTTLNFNSVAPAGSGATYVGPTYALDSATFSYGPLGSDNLLFILGPEASFSPGLGVPVISSQSTEANANPYNDLLISFASPQTAVGFNYLVDPGTVTITLSDGTVETIASPNDEPATNFFGVTGSAGITSIDLAIPATPPNTNVPFSDSFNVSDVYFTPSVSAVPEPSSLALLATGLLGCGGALRKKLARA